MEEVFDQEWEPTHPAELAANYGGGDEHDFSQSSNQVILRSLRKAVFSVPLMQQDEILERFKEIDRQLNHSFNLLIYGSDRCYEYIRDLILKISAGNTYGKNIYQKEQPDEEDDSRCKPTYKQHEVDFLERSYFILRGKSTNFETLKKDLESCRFIRGVIEESIEIIIPIINLYLDLNWQAVEAKLDCDFERHATLIEHIKRLDTEYGFNCWSYGILGEVKKSYDFFLKERALIMAPYLRSVYKAARNTARNTSQLLDNFQNGSSGLVRAVSCYSTHRPSSFSAVVKWWVKQTMLLSIKEKANFMKLPVSTWQSYTQLERVKVQLGGEDNYGIIARKAGMSEAKVQAVYDAVKTAQVYSLNKTYDTEDKLSLEDIVSFNNYNAQDELTEVLREYCSQAKFDLQEKLVIALRYGMPDILAMKPLPLKKIVTEAFRQNWARVGYNFVPE